MKRSKAMLATVLAAVLLSGCLGAGDGTEVSDKDLYAAYNGGKVQRLVSEDGDNYSPARCNDIIFYRAEKEETLDSVIAKMKREILEPLTVPAQDRPFTVTAYYVEEQTQVVPLPLSADDTQTEVPQWIRDWKWEETAEEAWLLPVLEGAYCFEGTDFVSMDTLLEEDDAGDGMVPFVKQGSEETFQYILTRRENVYRLQRAVNLMK